MTLAELIYQHSLRLPEHAAREALDFIELLEPRCGAVPAVEVGDPQREARRREALARLAEVRIPWGSRPIPDRDALYDDARGGLSGHLSGQSQPALQFGQAMCTMGQASACPSWGPP